MKYLKELKEHLETLQYQCNDTGMRIAIHMTQAMIEKKKANSFINRIKKIFKKNEATGKV
jgi:hypothetical protein